MLGLISVGLHRKGLSHSLSEKLLTQPLLFLNSIFIISLGIHAAENNNSTVFQIWVYRTVCRWRSHAFRAGFQGGRSPPWVKKGVAGSAEGGLERLGAHR